MNTWRVVRSAVRALLFTGVLATPTAELGEVDEQLQRFARGVSGVPYFILSDGKRRIRMSGAQPPEQFLDALEQLGAIEDA